MVVKPDHIILIGFGSPEKKEEVRPYLEYIVKTRGLPPGRIEEVESHYEHIGGSSPYNKKVFELAGELTRQTGLPVFCGMRFWNPFIDDTVKKIADGKLKSGIAVILAPHSSEVSREAYIQCLMDAVKKNGGGIQYQILSGWHKHPGFIQAWTEVIQETLKRAENAALLFTAHSIPSRMPGADLYQKQIQESCELIAGRLGVKEFKIGFQSRSGNPEDPWLEPSVEERMNELKKEGRLRAVLAPIGFLCDNAEILYDLDIEIQQQCRSSEMEYYRTPMVMTRPAFTGMLSSIIETLKKGEPSMNAHVAAPAETLDIREKGSPKDGQPQVMDRRLYCQLQVFTGCSDLSAIIKKVSASGIPSAVYANMNDPYGFGVLMMSENPSVFVEKARELFNQSEFSKCQRVPHLTMIGRTYSSGFEPDLEDWLIKKPLRTALNPKWPWAVWYPLRRKPEFATLSREDQRRILMEHAVLGKQYGASELAYDVRLSCYGIDENDNEFVIGVVSSELYPLSRLIQDMRKTEQTSKYIQSLGPFFTGKAVWQSENKG